MELGSKNVVVTFRDVTSVRHLDRKYFFLRPTDSREKVIPFRRSNFENRTTIKGVTKIRLNLNPLPASADDVTRSTLNASNWRTERPRRIKPGVPEPSRRDESADIGVDGVRSDSRKNR